MRAEIRPLLLELAVGRQREHLKAAAVGQYRSLPPVKLVQSPGLLQYLDAGAQVEMVGVTEYYLGLHVVAQLVHVHGLDRAERAHRHENRRLYRPVVGGYQPCAGIGVGRGGLQLKFHSQQNSSHKVSTTPRLLQ